MTKQKRSDFYRELQITKVSLIEINLGNLWYIGKHFQAVILNRFFFNGLQATKLTRNRY